LTSRAAFDWKKELARPELFDEGVEAARNACIAGASLASAAVTAAAWYDNPLTGAGALVACMRLLAGLPLEVAAWRQALEPRVHAELAERLTPGFGFVPSEQSRVLIELLAQFARDGAETCASSRTSFFLKSEALLGAIASSLNHAGFAALVCLDQELAPRTAERAFLSARIETAMAEADRARELGLANFPFFSNDYRYDGPEPERRSYDLSALRKAVGID
jgi:hypothetical protein